MDSISNLVAPPLATIPGSLGSTPNPNAAPAKVAQQFEGLFASLLIKNMRQTVDSETMFGKDAGDVLEDHMRVGSEVAGLHQ